jgi:hypothetical protein
VYLGPAVSFCKSQARQLWEKDGPAGSAKVLQEGSRQIKRWSGPKMGQRGPQRCCKRAADRSRGGLVLRRASGVHRESASGVDDPTCICSCKRADVGARRAKRGLHSCRKRPAEEGYGAEGVAGAASLVMGRVQSMLSSQPQCMFMQ